MVAGRHGGRLRVIVVGIGPGFDRPRNRVVISLHSRRDQINEIFKRTQLQRRKRFGHYINLCLDKGEKGLRKITITF